MCPRYLYVFRYIIDIFTFYGKTIKEIYFLYHNINYTITQDLNPANHTYTPSKLGRVGYVYRWGEYELFFYPYRLGKAEYEKNPANAGFFVSPMQCSEEGAPRYGDLFFAVFNCRAQNTTEVQTPYKSAYWSTGNGNYAVMCRPN